MQRYAVSDDLTALYRIIGGVDEFDVWVFSDTPNAARWDVMVFRDNRSSFIGFDLRMPKDENFPARRYAEDTRLIQQSSQRQVPAVLAKFSRDQIQRIMLLIQYFAPDMATAGDIYPELRKLLDAESGVRSEPNKED